MSERQSLILDLTLFQFNSYAHVLLVGSRGMCVLWTHSNIFYIMFYVVGEEALHEYLKTKAVTIEYGQ